MVEWMFRPRFSRPRFLRGATTERPVDAHVIRTQRLTLRPHRVEDAARWHAIQSHPDVLRYVPWPKRDPDQSREHLEHRTRHTRLWQRGDFLAMAIELDGRLIGDVALHLREVEPERRTAEISWIVDPRYARRGYAREAADALLDVAFDELRAQKVVAMIDEQNERSIALAKRLRFTRAHDGKFVTTADRRRGSRALARR